MHVCGCVAVCECVSVCPQCESRSALTVVAVMIVAVACRQRRCFHRTGEHGWTCRTACSRRLAWAWLPPRVKARARRASRRASMHLPLLPVGTYASLPLLWSHRVLAVSTVALLRPCSVCLCLCFCVCLCVCVSARVVACVWLPVFLYVAACLCVRMCLCARRSNAGDRR